MKVAIIGCGVAGLAAIRRCNEYDIECVAFEKTSDIGGTWVYVEHAGNNEFGMPIHSSMYSSLRTNLPTILMEYPGFKYRENCDDFPSHKEVYRYLHEFADSYNLWPNIKLYHYVEMVNRSNQVWEVTVKDLQTNIKSHYQFDAIFIANGHYSVPSYPNIPGIENFEGIMIHSHNYRTPDLFKNKRVVIIGSNASGLDLTFECSNVASMIFLSYHQQKILEFDFPENVILKPDISSVTKNTVSFNDGSSEDVDIFLFCTGYKYSFPFLNESCGIGVNGFVYPLYKELINISQPTMCFLGIMKSSLVFPVVDIQVRVFVKILKSLIQLPSNDEMKQTFLRELEIKKARNIPFRKYHDFGKGEFVTCEQYTRDLEIFGKIKPLPNVIFEAYNLNMRRWSRNYKDLRKIKFEIFDKDLLFVTYL